MRTVHENTGSRSEGREAPAQAVHGSEEADEIFPVRQIRPPPVAFLLGPVPRVERRSRGLVHRWLAARPGLRFSFDVKASLFLGTLVSLRG